MGQGLHQQLAGQGHPALRARSWGLSCRSMPASSAYGKQLLGRQQAGQLLRSILAAAV